MASIHAHGSDTLIVLHVWLSDKSMYIRTHVNIGVAFARTHPWKIHCTLHCQCWLQGPFLLGHVGVSLEGQGGGLPRMCQV